MNLVIIIVAAILVYVTTASQEKLSLDSLCIVDQDKCVVEKEKNEKELKNIQGFYCLSETDLRKIVGKLKQQ